MTGRIRGTVPAEVPVTRDLHVLAPKFRSAIERVLDTMRGLGHNPIVFETLRTHDRQRFLFGFGREYDDGRGIVTHSSDADETWHGYGLAVDIVCGTKYWNASGEFWAALGRACEREGLEWGGWWQFLDRPHIQWGKPMRRSPSPRAGRLLASGGPPAVWREVGAL
jgi:peptidoglycan L-alanyl-D-glutamate endopeptidase CwlK